MQSFNGDKELKAALVKEIKWHQEQDKIAQGAYEDDGMFCAVGCSLRSLNIIKKEDKDVSAHERYETELGIPEILARLEDGLFEEMSKEDMKTWPLRFIEAIPVGVDLSMVFPKLVIWEWRDKEHGLSTIKEIQEDKELYDCCEAVCVLYERHLAGEKIEVKEWQTLEDLADKIYWAWARARARAGARAWAGAWAWAGARAGAGAWAGAWAWAGARAGAGARAWAEYEKQIMVAANKLLELLTEAK